MATTTSQSGAQASRTSTTRRKTARRRTTASRRSTVDHDGSEDAGHAGPADRRAGRSGPGGREPSGAGQPRLDGQDVHHALSHPDGFEREIKRFERRGVTARNRFERQVSRTRTRFERQLRQRRSLVERTVKQNRRRLEREVRSVRRDLGKQSGAVGTRFEKLVSDAQGLLTQRGCKFPRGAMGARRGKVRRPHNLAGECSTLSSLNRWDATHVAPRRFVNGREAGTRHLQ